MLNKIVEWLLWGFFMGIGWVVGNNAITFIGSFLHK